MDIGYNVNLKALALALPKPLYAVGGCVRNAFLGCGGTDCDLASANGEGDLLAALEKVGFTAAAVYKRTGTVMFVGKDGTHYEHTRFRAENYAEGGGHTPEEVRPTENIEEDARRRDFKCNAVYYNIEKDQVVDPLGGAEDIKKRVLDTVTEPEKVFRSDGLRLLRLCRFAGELGFKPTDAVKEAAFKFKENIADISPERIYDELKKMLVADTKYPFSPENGHYNALEICSEIGVLRIILPELALGKNMPQRSDFHKYDVLEHSFRTALYADKEVRLAALLHDVGKPYAMINRGAYASHAADGEKIAREILERLKAPKAVTDEVCRLVGAHMLDLDLSARENTVRRYIVEYSDIYDKLILLKQADYSACKDDVSPSPTVVKWNGIYAKMRKEGAPFKLSELKINGCDLAAIGFRGKEIGAALGKLFREAVINPKINEAEKLKEKAAKLFAEEKK